MKNLKNSEILKTKARKIIPHYTGTFSRSPTSFIDGIYPAYVKSGNGCKLVDVDGNEFIDFFCGLGPITLGYNYTPVNNAIKKQLKNGILFSLPHPIEVELSEIICKTIPHAEMIKLEKSGSNAVTAAVRAARAITNREKIAYCGSGGVWHDWQAAMVSRDGGVPKYNRRLIKIFEYNDIKGLEKIFDDNKNQIAAIVLEPTHYEIPKNGFLKKVRKIADENNSLLILDEIVTGFRFDIKGGQKYFNIKGDLVCFGKGMGNGLPISAITGPSEFMKIYDKLWVSSTNNSENLSIAGTIATINEMIRKKTIEHCWRMGRKLMDEWNKITDENHIDAKMNGFPVRMDLTYKKNNTPSLTLKSLLLKEMLKEGIFMSILGTTYLSYSHKNEDIKKTLEALEKSCKIMNKLQNENNLEKHLGGKLPKIIWEMKIKPTKKNEKYDRK